MPEEERIYTESDMQVVVRALWNDVQPFLGHQDACETRDGLRCDCGFQAFSDGMEVELRRA